MGSWSGDCGGEGGVEVAGEGTSSSQVMAMGRSPLWLRVSGGAQEPEGAVVVSKAAEQQGVQVPHLHVVWYRRPVGLSSVVRDWLSQWIRFLVMA